MSFGKIVGVTRMRDSTVGIAGTHRGVHGPGDDVRGAYLLVHRKRRTDV